MPKESEERRLERLIDCTEISVPSNIRLNAFDKETKTWGYQLACGQGKTYWDSKIAYLKAYLALVKRIRNLELQVQRAKRDRKRAVAIQESLVRDHSNHRDDDMGF